MQRMNEGPMRNLGVSRRELFEKIERAALIGLPAEDWEFAEWRRARVSLDYHIEAIRETIGSMCCLARASRS
jgi:hypothetical protein